MPSDLPAADLVRVWLGRGGGHAQTIARLAALTSLSRREVEAAIEAMRMDGVPVCTGANGVWLSSEKAELRAQIEARRARARTILVGNKGLRKAIAALEQVHQPSIWEAA